MEMISDTNLQSMLELPIKCPLCGSLISDYDEFESHLLDYHFMTLSDYYERENKTTKDNGYCWKCNTYRAPLTFLDSNICDYHLPCWNCVGDKKYEKVQAIQTTQSAIHDFYSIIAGDRYFQMFIIDDIYIRTTLSHEFDEFKRVLKLLRPRDRNKLWLIDYIPGYPHTICEDNIEGLKIVDIDSMYNVVSSKSVLSMKDYEVVYPSIVPYDSRHHSRYNIFNTSDNRKTKRLRLSTLAGEEKSKKCIKFFNSGDDELRSLFCIKRISTGEIIDPSTDMSRADYTILKLVLMRNKTFMRLIIDMLEEVSKNVGLLRDEIFLKNTVNINPWVPDLKANITWLPENRKGFINISIL